MSQATNKKGAPTQQAANQYAAQMKASRVAPHAYTGYRVPNALELSRANNDTGTAFYGVNSTQYPTRPFALDDRDSEVAMLRDLTLPTVDPNNNNVGQPPFISDARPLPIQDWELQYMKDKAAQEDYAAYNQWLEQRYDLNDMATRAWFKQIAPDFFTSRRELLKEMIDRHAKYSYLRFAGPESEEDLRFEYAVETGRIPIPQGPFYDPIEMMKNDAREAVPNTNFNIQDGAGVARVLNYVGEINKKAYQYGMFNPVKPRTAEQSGNASNPLNVFDIVGNPTRKFYGFVGAKVPVNYNWNQQYAGQDLTGSRSTAAQTEVTMRAMNASTNGGLPPPTTTGVLPSPPNLYNASQGTYVGTPRTYKPISNPRYWNQP